MTIDVIYAGPTIAIAFMINETEPRPEELRIVYMKTRC
jgi:hypothetical protein